MRRLHSATENLLGFPDRCAPTSNSGGLNSSLEIVDVSDRESEREVVENERRNIDRIHSFITESDRSE